MSFVMEMFVGGTVCVGCKVWCTVTIGVAHRLCNYVWVGVGLVWAARGLRFF